MADNRTEERSDSWLGVSKQRFSNPLSLPRMSPNVSRHLTESHVTLFCPYRFLCPSFLPSSSSFSILCLRFRYHQDSFRHSKFLLLYTFANSGDPARFLFPITFFPRSMLLRIPRDPPIFLFVIELNFRLLLFFYFLLFYILPSFFSSFARFRVWFCNFLCLISAHLRPLSFLSIPWRSQSRLSIRHGSTLFSTFSFYFFLSFASSASFESAFPRALFMSLALFHASFPSSSTSSFTSFYPPSSLQPPSLISLFLSFSLLRRPRFTLIAHKEK